jgi:hypothetical protein
VREQHTFYAEDEGTNPYLKQLQQNCPAPYELELKVGAQVPGRYIPFLFLFLFFWSLRHSAHTDRPMAVVVVVGR